MLLGKTYSEKNEKEQKKLEKMQGRVKKFIILPRKLNDGRWAFLQNVWIDYNIFKNKSNNYLYRSSSAGKYGIYFYDITYHDKPLKVK